MLHELDQRRVWRRQETKVAHGGPQEPTEDRFGAGVVFWCQASNTASSVIQVVAESHEFVVIQIAIAIRIVSNRKAIELRNGQDAAIGGGAVNVEMEGTDLWKMVSWTKPRR